MYIIPSAIEQLTRNEQVSGSSSLVGSPKFALDTLNTSREA